MGFNLEDYETVDSRIKRFYADHEDGSILTELLSDPNSIDTVVVHSAIYIGDKQRATGLAFEKSGEGGMANKTSHLENCETSAIGRALANFNYSGDKRPSREEMKKTQTVDDKARAIYDECKKILGDKMLDGDINQEEFDAGIKWLETHAMTTHGMGIAKKKLEERFS